MSEMLTGPKKIVDGLTEVFRGLTQMCEGMAEQIELLEFTADDVTEEDKLIPPAKLPPVDTAPKGQEMPHPRKKPVMLNAGSEAGQRHGNEPREKLLSKISRLRQLCDTEHRSERRA